MSSVPRFFVPPSAIADGVVTLPPEAAHHAVRVLRLRPGERLTIHDGAENVYHSTLIDGAMARIEWAERSRSEPALRITVVQALPKTPDKIEQVLQHGTEIGAAGFAFWAAQRSVARLSEGEKIEKRLVRWRGVIQGAAEQSGRGVLPPVEWWDTATVKTSLAQFDAALILHESAPPGSFRGALESLSPTASRLLIIVGPEGGLTDSEIAAFTAAGGHAVSLGPRILRTETAALVGLAQALYARGEGEKDE